MEQEKDYIDFEVTPYALPKVALALHEKFIPFVVTQEDWDLHVRIDKDILEKRIYDIKEDGPITAPSPQ